MNSADFKTHTCACASNFTGANCETDQSPKQITPILKPLNQTKAIIKETCVFSENHKYCDSNNKGTKRDYTNLDEPKLTAVFCKNQCKTDKKCAIAIYFESSVANKTGVSKHCVHYRTGNYKSCAFDKAPKFDNVNNYVFSFYNEDPCTKGVQTNIVPITKPKIVARVGNIIWDKRLLGKVDKSLGLGKVTFGKFQNLNDFVFSYHKTKVVDINWNGRGLGTLDKSMVKHPKNAFYVLFEIFCILS